MAGPFDSSFCHDQHGALNHCNWNWNEIYWKKSKHGDKHRNTTIALFVFQLYHLIICMKSYSISSIANNFIMIKRFRGEMYIFQTNIQRMYGLFFSTIIFSCQKFCFFFSLSLLFIWVRFRFSLCGTTVNFATVVTIQWNCLF